MNCIETQRRIRKFLNDSLEKNEKMLFLNHVCSCKECMNELKTEFYFSRGLDLFDEDSDADIDMDIEKFLKDALASENYRSKRVKHIRTAIMLTLVFAMCLIMLSGSY